MDKKTERQCVAVNGFKIDPYDKRNYEIPVSKFTNWCAMMKYLLPCVLSMIIVELTLALTKVIIWSVFYFLFGIAVFTFLCGCAVALFQKGKSYYVITPLGIYKQISDMQRWAYYENINAVKVSRCLFNKDCGSINFKLYNGSGINLEMILLKGLNETYDRIKFFWELNKNVREFEKIFTADYWDDCIDFVNFDSARVARLPDCLRVYYVLYCLYDSLCETGFDEFFIDSRECVPYLLECCELFGLDELTAICKRAVELNEKYGIADNDDLPEECLNELEELALDMDELDGKYDLKSLMKDYYVRHYEKFDFENAAGSDND